VSARVERRFVGVPAGEIHCAIAGSGPPVLLLHQTPRSWDEYRDTLPLLGEHFRAIAMDTLGFGDSSKPPLEEDSVERWAEVAASLLDALGIERAAVVGHHTGAVIAVELAAAFPERIEAAVLSSAPLVDAGYRAAHSGRAVVDEVERRPDGTHMTELWRLRQPFYPADDVDLLERFVVDALKAGPRAAEGHRVVARYEMERRLPLVRCPVLLVAATDDPHAYQFIAPLHAALPTSTVAEVAGGMVALPDQLPHEFAAAITDFLSATFAVSSRFQLHAGDGGAAVRLEPDAGAGRRTATRDHDRP
jgi:pimeloyl-ACP methyl ester carboxylesterase